MNELRVLSAEQIASVFTVSDALSAVESAYRQKAAGTGQAWPMVYEQFEPNIADMDIRSANLQESGLFGLKLTSWFSNNPALGLPDIFGTILVCDNSTGKPRALLNASALTGLRTGAAAALGIKALARPNSTRLMVAGSGHMCPFCIAATLAACPSFTEVAVWNPRESPMTQERLALIESKVNDILSAADLTRSYSLTAAQDGAAAAANADAIITVTPATSPIIADEWIAPGTHISCVGADMPGKQELASSLVARSRIFVDDRAQSVSSGELEVPVKQGAITSHDIVAELGEVLDGSRQGRTCSDDITVFDTSGIALQDIAAAHITLERATKQGIGTRAAW